MFGMDWPTAAVFLGLLAFGAFLIWLMCRDCDCEPCDCEPCDCEPCDCPLCDLEFDAIREDVER